MKKILSAAIILLLLNTVSYAENKKEKRELIQIAVLLDSSGSMTGLIDQAKSQIWKIINELALAKRNGISPDIEVGLYEYGKSTIPQSEGYLRMLSPLSTDLDMVSDELFKITTNGGDEYCGQVIKAAVESLKWSNNKGDLKVIIIAGNEPFTQGKIDYRDSCRNAISKGIIVNTIFCGNEREGIRTGWKNGADLADGKYMAIDHTRKISRIEAPQDDEILKLGRELNKTYIGYGKKGSQYKKRQSAQDMNAQSMSKSVMVQRSFTKSSKKYDNKRWDLVDALKSNTVKVEDIKKEDLPSEMQNMEKEERVKYVKKKMEERKILQKRISELRKKREAFIIKERKKRAGSDKTLDSVIVKTVREQAIKKKFSFK